MTNKGSYELRLGGERLTNEKRPNSLRIELSVIGKESNALLTDDHTLYFELISGECLVHSFTRFHIDGKLDFALTLRTKIEYEAIWQELGKSGFLKPFFENISLK